MIWPTGRPLGRVAGSSTSSCFSPGREVVRFLNPLFGGEEDRLSWIYVWSLHFCTHTKKAVEHFLLDCKLYDQARVTLFQRLLLENQRYWKVSFIRITSMKDSELWPILLISTLWPTLEMFLSYILGFRWSDVVKSSEPSSIEQVDEIVYAALHFHCKFAVSCFETLVSSCPYMIHQGQALEKVLTKHNSRAMSSISFDMSCVLCK